MNSPAARGSTLGVIALVVCAAMWSLNGPLIKLLQLPETGASGAQVAPGVSGIAIACYRSLLGGLIFLPLALGRIRTIRNVPPAWPIGSVIAFTLMTACFVIATTKTAVGSSRVDLQACKLEYSIVSPK